MYFSCEEGTRELPSLVPGESIQAAWKGRSLGNKEKKKLESDGIGHQNKVGNFDLNATVAQKDPYVSIFL